MCKLFLNTKITLVVLASKILTVCLEISCLKLLAFYCLQGETELYLWACSPQ